MSLFLTACDPKPIIQELAEKRLGKSFPEQADYQRFFQLFTLVWAAYFFIKATFYLWIGRIMPLPETMAIRSAGGTASLVLMIAVSTTQGRRLFLFCRKLGLPPPAQDQAQS